MAQNGITFHFDNFFRDVKQFGTIRLMQIGEVSYEPGWGPGTHQQWCYEVSYIVSGSGTFRTDDSAHVVRANDLVLNGRSCTHGVFSDRGESLGFIYLGFDIPDAARNDPVFDDILALSDRKSNIVMQDVTGVNFLLRRIVAEYYNTLPDFYDMITTTLRMTLLLLKRNLLFSGSGVLSEPPHILKGEEGALGEAVYAAVRYIENHLHTRLSVGLIAEKVGYNESYFSHLFSQRMGVTLQQYIRQQKMERAKELIPAVGVRQAAQQLGYTSERTFARSFHSVFGFTPVWWSAHCGEEDTQNTPPPKKTTSEP